MPADMHEILRPGPLADPVDSLLAEVAVKIQLSRTNYQLAEERYGTIRRWLERDGSPLKDRIDLFYPQGSAAIGTTISSKTEEDQFDIDLMVEIQPWREMTAHELLDELYATVRGEPGSMYYDKAHRMTRCVQVEYANMHIDLTPAVLRQHPFARSSWIAHSKIEKNDHRFVWANPWGFADWFKSKVPADLELVKELAARAAEVVELPDQDPVYRKSNVVLALQLLKRWRNLRYERRAGCMPPSVLLSYFVAEHAGYRPFLAAELEFQATALHDLLAARTRMGLKVDVSNPRCVEDKLTDRWPETIVDQMTFVDDLKDFVAKIKLLRGATSLEQKKKNIQDLFGERIGAAAFEELMKRMGGQKQAGTLRHAIGSGAIGLASVAASQPSSASNSGAVRTTPSHSFYGGTKPTR